MRKMLFAVLMVLASVASARFASVDIPLSSLRDGTEYNPLTAASSTSIYWVGGSGVSGTALAIPAADTVTITGTVIVPDNYSKFGRFVAIGKYVLPETAAYLRVDCQKQSVGAITQTAVVVGTAKIGTAASGSQMTRFVLDNTISVQPGDVLNFWIFRTVTGSRIFHLYGLKFEYNPKLLGIW